MSVYRNRTQAKAGPFTIGTRPRITTRYLVFKLYYTSWGECRTVFLLISLHSNATSKVSSASPPLDTLSSLLWQTTPTVAPISPLLTKMPAHLGYVLLL